MNKEKIAERLKELRGDKTLEYVSSKIDITPSALSNYEMGKRIPRDTVKVRIAQFYGVSIQELFYS